MSETLYKVKDKVAESVPDLLVLVEELLDQEISKIEIQVTHTIEEDGNGNFDFESGVRHFWVQSQEIVEVLEGAPWQDGHRDGFSDFPKWNPRPGINPQKYESGYRSGFESAWGMKRP